MATNAQMRQPMPVERGVTTTTTSIRTTGASSNTNHVENAFTPTEQEAESARHPSQAGQRDSEQNHDEDGDYHDQEVDPDKPAAPGWTYLQSEDPYFQDKGIHAKAPPGLEGPVSGRTRSARRTSTPTEASANAGEYVSDCLPSFVALASLSASDLATDHVIPKSYKEAISGLDKEHWKAAIAKELRSVKEAGTYLLVSRGSLPEDTLVIGHTWVFRVKNNEDGTVAKYKARICIDGSRQRPGLDFDQTFAPVAQATTIRLVLALAASRGMHLRQYDIEVAFLAAKIDKPVYMHVPQGSAGGPYQVWKLQKSLYGLKQAPRLFNAHLNRNLTVALGFVQSAFDPCLYFKLLGKHLSLLAVVVDDILLATTSLQYPNVFQKILGNKYKLKSLGRPSYMVGMQLGYLTNSLTVSQSRYIQDVAKRFDLSDCKPVNTPASTTAKLTKLGQSGSTKDSPRVNTTKYRSLVGALMYCVMTRPDVATSVSICARYLAEPRQTHWDAATRILRYLLHSLHVKLTFCRCHDLQLCAYVDASWADDQDTRRSRFGFAIYVGTNLISWKSKLHPCIALSTAESEYIAATEVCKVVVWLRNILDELKISQRGPTLIYEDNQACIQMASQRMVTGRNKHIQLKQHFVRSLALAKLVKLLYAPTDQQRADNFTKNLAFPDFLRILGLLLGQLEHGSQA
jgi:hypothetical protein